MKDTYGREITYLRLSVTELCNLRCRYCMPADGVCKKEHDDMLTEEEIVMAVETAAELGVNKLRITGGEPLVKKNIVSICSRTAAVPGIREVCITTNGTRLPELARPLRDAGVGRLNISLDTLDADKYRYITRIGSLDDALRGIETALDAGFDKIKLNAVLIGGFNDDEIVPLADLTKRWPVDLRFIELMPMYDSGDFGPASFIGAYGGGAGRRRGAALPPAGRTGTHRSHQSAVQPFLPRVQPHPSHGGRQAQALPARQGGISHQGARPRRDARGLPHGNAGQARVARRALLQQPEPRRPQHEHDRRVREDAERL